MHLVLQNPLVFTLIKINEKPFLPATQFSSVCAQTTKLGIEGVLA